MQTIDIAIDPEFQSLIFPLSAEEMGSLEESVLSEGCRVPLDVWQETGILLDGHHRKDICQRHSIPFKTNMITLRARADAELWIIRNQVARRNLTPWQKAELALKLKPIIAARAKERQGARADICQNSDESSTPIDTKRELARIAGVSHDTIHKVEKISQTAPEELKQKARSGEVSVHAAYEEVKKQERVEKKRQVAEEVGSKDEDDQSRMKALGINIQPYDVWIFSGCHEAFGRQHPGRIPGQLVAHVLYFFTQPGALVIDPMVGSGTTIDVCHAMGRRCFGYDMDGRHERPDIIPHDLATGWPEETKDADLIFWDPPYFSKMDSANINGGYGEGSISKLSRDEYLEFFSERLTELFISAKKGTRLAFLMSDWDDAEGKQKGIFSWHYASILEASGWSIKRQVQVPLSTQQVHPDIVNRFRESRRLARLGRYLIIGEA